jgi:hypothetical protein
MRRDAEAYQCDGHGRFSSTGCLSHRPYRELGLKTSSFGAVLVLFLLVLKLLMLFGIPNVDLLPHGCLL